MRWFSAPQTCFYEFEFKMNLNEKMKFFKKPALPKKHFFDLLYRNLTISFKLLVKEFPPKSKRCSSCKKNIYRGFQPPQTCFSHQKIEFKRKKMKFFEKTSRSENFDRN